MGRSRNSSHYQFSTNKLISRVHIRAVYIASKPPAPKKVQVECMGWNGVKVHCQGKAWDLMKGDTFTSETEDADIMVDVQDARVLLTWPRHQNKISTPTDSDSHSTWDSENSPQRAAAAARNRPPYTSPLRQQHRLQSPVSPSPAVQATHAAPSGHFASDPPIPIPVQVYEDDPSDAEKDKASPGSAQATQSTQFASQPLGAPLSSPSSNPNEFSDNDEENDPIITSFGPYGANLGARLERFPINSPKHRQPLNPLKEESISPQRGGQHSSSPKRRRQYRDLDVSDSLHREQETNPIANHVINQLAYSRVQSTPLSTLMQNLPAHLKDSYSSNTSSSNTTHQLSMETLREILNRTRCIGSVEREGKDAAGKRLESEYYYIPEVDSDEGRREIVDGLGGRGLRNCRKSHKVCHHDSKGVRGAIRLGWLINSSNTTGASRSSLEKASSACPLGHTSAPGTKAHSRGLERCKCQHQYFSAHLPCSVLRGLRPFSVCLRIKLFHAIRISEDNGVGESG